MPPVVEPFPVVAPAEVELPAEPVAVPCVARFQCQGEPLRVAAA